MEAECDEEAVEAKDLAAPAECTRGTAADSRAIWMPACLLPTPQSPRRWRQVMGARRRRHQTGHMARYRTLGPGTLGSRVRGRALALNQLERDLPLLRHELSNPIPGLLWKQTVGWSLRWKNQQEVSWADPEAESNSQLY